MKYLGSVIIIAYREIIFGDKSVVEESLSIYDLSVFFILEALISLKLTVSVY